MKNGEDGCIGLTTNPFLSSKLKMNALTMQTSKMETPSFSTESCIDSATTSSSTKMETPSSYSRVGGWNRSGWDILSNGGESVKMRPYAFNIMYGGQKCIELYRFYLYTLW